MVGNSGYDELVKTYTRHLFRRWRVDPTFCPSLSKTGAAIGSLFMVKYSKSAISCYRLSVCVHPLQPLPPANSYTET